MIRLQPCSYSALISVPGHLPPLRSCIARQRCGRLRRPDPLPIRLLEEHPDVLAATQARYRWISVDEYQDVNAAQYRLLRLLTATGSDNLPRRHGEHGDDSINLCVIGDPDQAIYGFRGADRRYFLQFEQDYPGAVTLNLSRNYRSSQRILDAASQVIAHNPDRKSVEILAEFADEVKLDVYRAPTDKAEAEYVVHQIEQMVGGTSHFSLDSGRGWRCGPGRGALLRRFRRALPAQRTESSPDGSIRPLRHPVSDDRAGAADQPQSGARGAGASVAAVQSTVASACSAIRWIVRCAIQRIALQLLPELAQARRAGAQVARLIEQIVAQIVERRRKPYDAADTQRLHQLALRAVPFEDRLADFLEATSLQSETDAYDPRADRVTLMSLHASKGLEFPVVFIVGCEEGLLPYERKGEAVDVEEERRLFYVGLTRAGRKLILTHAAQARAVRPVHGERASRFVGDIEAALKEVQERQYRPPEQKPESGQMSLF